MRITAREMTLLRSCLNQVERLQNSALHPAVKDYVRDAKDNLLKALKSAEKE